ncbi:MAG TPA: DUF1573 domain-containing protein [Bacteroidia bacterium]|nr:DUF1573 domain-containing protein [Bacteroidia bacterium]
MKFYLALPVFLLSVCCSAQSLRVNINRILLDTIPYTIESSPLSVVRYRVVKIQCRNESALPVRITKVRMVNSYYATKIERNTLNAYPEICDPGKTYELSFSIFSTDSCRYVIYTGNGDSVSVRLWSRKPVFLEFEKPVNMLNGVDGQMTTVNYTVVNRSAVPVSIDTIQRRGALWECNAPVPFWLAPGEKYQLVFRCYGDTGAKMFSYMRFHVFFHPENGYSDYISDGPFVHFMHGVVITSGTQKNFGRIQAGERLATKITVKNMGFHKFDLRKSQSNYVTFSKTELAPGDTATGYVEWNSFFARDSFRMEIPLFTDVRNGKSTMTFRGTVGSSTDREKSVNPDSMIWVEATHIDCDTLYRSQWRLEKIIHCRNNSPVPILVTRASTGDGGSYAEYPREPIQPGQSFEIKFVQDLNSRVGRFSRGVYMHIQFLDGTNCEVTKVVSVTGFVVKDI